MSIELSWQWTIKTIVSDVLHYSCTGALKHQTNLGLTDVNRVQSSIRETRTSSMDVKQKLLNL